ncbi:MAG: recombination protein RecR [Bdellovibrionales bacterium]|nr:recombination protein RecR [Bdellovibrionales bacterium]
MKHVPSLEKLVHELSRLPGIGPKSAERLGYYILRSSDEYAEQLRESLKRVKEVVHECPSCYSFTESDSLCHYCSDTSRQNDLICVVEDPADIARIDAAGVFRGRYHVLHGTISPLDGVSPEDLRIQELMEKVHKGLCEEGPKIREVILALDADLEGDTTVLYLAKALQDKDIKVTRIAHGVPIGGDINYIDQRTLGRALENRINV